MIAEVREMGKLPEGWKIVRLGDYSTITTGKKDVNEGNPNGDFPFFTCSRTPTRSDRYSFDAEALLIAGNGEVGTIHYYKGKFEAYQRTYVLYNFNNSLLYIKYTYYHMQKRLVKSLENEKIGTTIQYIKYSNLNDFLINLPSLPEQHKIAEILETVDDAIEKTDKIIEKHKRIKQGLMQDLLTKGIDERGQIRSDETHRFKDSLLGRIPEEWEVVELGKVGSFRKGKGISKNEVLETGIPAIRYGELYTRFNIKIEKFFSFISQLSAKKSEKVYKGEILFAGSGETVEDIGKSAVLLNNYAYVGGDVIIFSPKIRITSLFLTYSLNFGVVRNNMSKLGQGFSVVHIYPTQLNYLNVPLPPLPEQHRIASILSQIDEAIEKEQRYKEKLERIKQGLMEDLLTGKVRVNRLIEEVEA